MSYTIISFQENQDGTSDSSFRPHSIKRLSDNETFTIGERVTNGTEMTGVIQEFSMLNGNVYVKTSWSGVGMNLNSLIKVPLLPSPFQIGDRVFVNQDKLSIFGAYVLSVHFHAGMKIKYDLEIPGKTPTRIYNVDGDIVLEKQKTEEDVSLTARI